MHFRLMIILMSSFNPCFAKIVKIGTYQNFNSEGIAIQGNIFLYKNKGMYQFCYSTGYIPKIYDSSVNLENLSYIKYIKSDTCISRYNWHKLSIQKHSIYLIYYNEISKKFVKHKQYSLSKKDSSDYVYLFSGPYNEYPSIEGRSFYRGRTSIRDTNGFKFDCFIQDEYKFIQTTEQYLFSRRIFIDTVTLLPIRYEFYDENGKIISFYLLTEINTPMAQVFQATGSGLLAGAGSLLDLQ